MQGRGCQRPGGEQGSDGAGRAAGGGGVVFRYSQLLCASEAQSAGFVRTESVAPRSEVDGAAPRSPLGFSFLAFLVTLEARQRFETEPDAVLALGHGVDAMEAILVICLVFWFLSAISNAGSGPRQSSNAREDHSSSSIEEYDEPNWQAPEQDVEGEIQVDQTHEQQDEAAHVTWADSKWLHIEAEVAQLKFDSEWTFERSVRDHDLAYGVRESIWTLDLHGLDTALARRALGQFLFDLRSSENRRCRIISGRGNNSRGGGVLQDLVSREIGKRCHSGEVHEWEDMDGHYDIRLPAKPTKPVLRVARIEAPRVVPARPQVDPSLRQWPCGHARGAGESHCWDCWFRDH